ETSSGDGDDSTGETSSGDGDDSTGETSSGDRDSSSAEISEKPTGSALTEAAQKSGSAFPSGKRRKPSSPEKDFPQGNNDSDIDNRVAILPPE
ncbi:hypothetical protein, partial [[Ruminococcus] lactaris]|uniref:hypothetical protein n=1 Tax=[Ruminococcus] lactaris TaxID=46228 RepID=UPI0039F46423